VDVVGTLATAAAMMPAVTVDAEATEALSNHDNVEGGDVASAKALPEPFTRGVVPAGLSEERRHEIASCRNATVAAVLLAFKERGYIEGKGA
ncbi:hypothetical protein OFB93_28575, partial [Escherichia coli]|nr:hypothetical protein [Escherichia coli]